MTVIEIDRLHALYDLEHHTDAERFDKALTALADSVLDMELFEYEPAGPENNAFAVCISTLGVEVEIDAANTRSTDQIARAWAAAIANALRNRLQSGEGVVVYPREVDLLVDIVRSVARGDRSRVWAWHQTGVTRSSWPAPDDIESLLCARVEFVPAVLAELAAEGLSWQLPLTSRGWVAVASAVAQRSGVSLSGALALAHRVESGPLPNALETWIARRVRSGSGPPTALVKSIWSTGTEVDQLAIATLILAVELPGVMRNPSAVSAVAAALTDRVRRIEPGGTSHPSPEHRESADVDSEFAPDETPRVDRLTPLNLAAQDGGAISDPTPISAPDEGALPDDFLVPAEEDAQPERSAFGGVLFLAHVYRELDLVARAGPGALAHIDPRELIGRVTSKVTDVAITDPAVLTLCGSRNVAEDAEVIALVGAGLLDRDIVALAEAVETVQTAIFDRLREPPGPWLWTREATIERQPGWVEATYLLSEVDLRIRVAGLDLDPGFVWWMGSVMRFRYV